MKPLIIQCKCGKVKKFGEWIEPNSGQKKAIDSGTYKKDRTQKCTDCK